MDIERGLSAVQNTSIHLYDTLSVTQDDGYHDRWGNTDYPVPEDYRDDDRDQGPRDMSGVPKRRRDDYHDRLGNTEYSLVKPAVGDRVRAKAAGWSDHYPGRDDQRDPRFLRLRD